jgi:predicted kinase
MWYSESNMQKSKLTHPVLITLYGLPGSGKTFFARQASDLLGIPHISSDRIRFELFEKPTLSKEENAVVFNMMVMMLEEYAKAGVPVVFDVSLSRAIDRKNMRELARKLGMESLLVWIQTDQDTAHARTRSRDRRKADDKYATELTREQFDMLASLMQQPTHEDFVVVSGKHLFDSQKNVLLRKFREMQLMSEQATSEAGVAKPELVNLVSSAKGRVDQTRRNVIIN